MTPDVAITCPIVLDVATRGDAITVRVMARPVGSLDADYRLTVENGASGNRSTQSGTARLHAPAAGKAEVTLVNLTLDGATSGNWHAILNVRPSVGSPYTIHRQAGEASRGPCG